MTKPADPKSLEGATVLTEQAPLADPLAKLREPFPPHQISKLPKETGAQAKKRKADQEAGRWPQRCAICEGFHHPQAVHLDYVGHAALTDRLLDTDLHWSWEPVAYTPEGLPAFDRNGGLWIKLTVCGVTRPGYGSADGKTGGDAVKEIIGDALRNAAMRFGAALDLWHKGDLHLSESESDEVEDRSGDQAQEPTKAKHMSAALKAAKPHIDKLATEEAVDGWVEANKVVLEKLSTEDYAAIRTYLDHHKATLARNADPFAEAA